MTLAGVWREIVSHATVAIVAGAVAFLAALELGGKPSPAPEAYVPRPTKRVAEAPVVVEQVPVALAKPDGKTRKRIAVDYRQPGVDTPMPGLADGWAQEIVSEVKFAPAPDGGTVLTTLDRATGRVQPTVKPSPEPRFSWRNRFEFAAAVGRTDALEDLVRAEVRWRPVKIRRLELGAAAGWERVDRGRAYFVGEIAWGSR